MNLFKIICIYTIPREELVKTCFILPSLVYMTIILHQLPHKYFSSLYSKVPYVRLLCASVTSLKHASLTTRQETHGIWSQTLRGDATLPSVCIRQMHCSIWGDVRMVPVSEIAQVKAIHPHRRYQNIPNTNQALGPLQNRQSFSCFSSLSICYRTLEKISKQRR